MSNALVTRFARDLQESLFPDNSFYKRAIDDTEYLDGAIVKLPQAGDNPEAFMNQTIYPVTPKARIEGEEEYSIDHFSTRPTHFRTDESMIYSFDKRRSILRSHELVLQTKIADTIAYRWAPTAGSNILRTTGSSTNDALAPGATGNRKAVIAKDIRRVKTLMTKHDIPEEGRFALLPADMLGQIWDLPEFTSYEKIGIPGLIVDGAIGRIYGFQVFERSRGVVYSNSPAPKSINDATATTDHLAGIFWHESFVRKAEGTTEVFINEGQADYHGSLFSAAVRAGGRKARTDGKGVIALVQDAA